MDIYINGRFLTQKITGVQRFGYEVLKSLDHLLSEKKIKHTFIILMPNFNKQGKYNFKNLKLVEVGKLQGHLWEQLELPSYAKGGLLINFCNTGPIFKRNQIVTIHDAAVYGFPSAFSFQFRTWYRFLLFWLGKNAKRILTVSEFSKRELMKYFSINPEKIRVVTEGKEQILTIQSNEEIIRKHNLEKGKYVLAVSSLNPNKNFRSIIQAIAFLEDKNKNFDFVIAGGTNPQVFKGSDLKIESSNVKYVGYVSDEELKALYENAGCFVYPSFYEGFGLPPLEAMACGCPVIVSKRASLPEVCGDSALYCDPEDSEDIANKIASVLENKELRKELSEKGHQRSMIFTWERCAQQILEVVDEMQRKK